MAAAPAFIGLFRVIPQRHGTPRDRQVAVALARQPGPARRSRPSDARQRRLQGVLRRFIRRPAVVSDDHQFHMFETRIGSHFCFWVEIIPSPTATLDALIAVSAKKSNG
jgi:hypothetical protein